MQDKIHDPAYADTQLKPSNGGKLGDFLSCFVLKFVFRFSLLLLEPGEIYFEDFSVFHYPYDLPEEEAIKRYNTSFTYYLLTCVYLIMS